MRNRPALYKKDNTEADQAVIKSDQAVIKSDQAVKKSDQAVIKSDQAVIKFRSGGYKGQKLKSLFWAGPSWVRQKFIFLVKYNEPISLVKLA